MHLLYFLFSAYALFSLAILSVAFNSFYLVDNYVNDSHEHIPSWQIHFNPVGESIPISIRCILISLLYSSEIGQFRCNDTFCYCLNEFIFT